MRWQRNSAVDTTSFTASCPKDTRFCQLTGRKAPARACTSWHLCLPRGGSLAVSCPDSALKKSSKSNNRKKKKKKNHITNPYRQLPCNSNTSNLKAVEVSFPASHCAQHSSLGRCWGSLPAALLRPRIVRASLHSWGLSPSSSGTSLPSQPAAHHQRRSSRTVLRAMQAAKQKAARAETSPAPTGTAGKAMPAAAETQHLQALSPAINLNAVAPHHPAEASFQTWRM